MGIRSINKNIMLYEDDAAGFKQWQRLCGGKWELGGDEDWVCCWVGFLGHTGGCREGVKQDGAVSGVVQELVLASHMDWCLSEIGFLASIKICSDTSQWSQGFGGSVELAVMSAGAVPMQKAVV